MIHLFLYVLLFLISNVSFAADNVCTNNLGNMVCTSGEVANINHIGNLSLSGTHVLGELRVIGNVEANHAEIHDGEITGIVDASYLLVKNKLNSIGKFNSTNSIFGENIKITGNFNSKNDNFNSKTEVIGDVKLNNATLKAEGEFTGKLTAFYSKFQAPIFISSCETSLNHSITNNVFIAMQKNCSDNGQIIRVDDQSQINGDIQFFGKNGKVYLSKNSSVNGRVLGGTIIRE